MAAWMALIAAAFISACFLLWKLGADSAPRLYAGLIVLILVNSGLLLSTGNPAGLVVSLTVITVYCFLQNRFVPAGILCLAIALAMKPHDAGPIWLYFLLVGGVYRKRALLTLVLTAVIAVAAVLCSRTLHRTGCRNTIPICSRLRRPGAAIIPDRQRRAAAALARSSACRQFSASSGTTPVSIIWPHSFALGAAHRRLVRQDVAFRFFAAAGLVCPCECRAPHDASDLSPHLRCAASAACRSCLRHVVDEKGRGGRSPAPSALWLTVSGIVSDGRICLGSFFQLTHYSGPAGTFAMFPAPFILLALAAFYLWTYLRATPVPPEQPLEARCSNS